MQNQSGRPILSYADFRYILLDENVDVSSSTKIIQSKGFQTIIVIRDGKPVGIVTMSDILEKVVDRDDDPDKVPLKEIMTAPVVTISSLEPAGRAIELMRLNKIKRLPIIEFGRVAGIVTQDALTNSICDSVIRKSFKGYRKSLKEKYKPILGNLGLVIQFAGILLVVPAIIGAFMNEASSSAGIFLAVIGLFSVGFMLNTYGEKSALNIKQSSLVVVSSFLLLGLFGSIPYMYLNPFYENIDAQTLFVNSFFESISGFTTTGLSVIAEPENLPQSLDFYRSYTQWVGGLSFIYIVMILFYPEEKLFALRGFLGYSQIPYKQLFVVVSVIFVAYSVILSGFLFLIGEINLLYDFAIIFSSVTGGGFVATSDFVSFENAFNLLPIGIGMILSALPFAFHFSLFKKEKWRKVLHLDFRKEILTKDIWRKILEKEIAVYLIFILVCIPIFGLLSSSNGLASVFHVVSASTNTGFQLTGMDSIPTAAKILLMFIMMVGGTAFSTAGGIKMGRFLLIYRKLSGLKISEFSASISAYNLEVAFNVQDGRHTEKESNGESSLEYQLRKYGKITKQALKVFFSDKTVVESIFVMILFVAMGLLAGYALAAINNSATLENAIFESISALTTTGLSTGMVTADSDLASKMILIVNMVAGRFEIIAILYIFIRPLRA